MINLTQFNTVVSFRSYLIAIVRLTHTAWLFFFVASSCVKEPWWSRLGQVYWQPALVHDGMQLKLQVNLPYIMYTIKHANFTYMLPINILEPAEQLTSVPERERGRLAGRQAGRHRQTDRQTD